MAILRTPADSAFSKCIRERANWTCERCGKHYPEGNRGGLDCSHHHSRGNWSIRFNPLNSEALCYGCHSYCGGTEERRREVLSEFEIELLWDLKADTGLGKQSRKTRGKGAIASHYREQLEIMRDSRAKGVLGRLDFESFF